MSRSFSVTFDYRSPFAYVASDAVFKALDAGADWEVSFTAFSLAQAHIEEGYAPVWARKEPHDAPGVLALEMGVVVRDEYPDAFRDVHLGFFRARFGEDRDISDPATVRDVLAGSGLDPAKLLAPEVMGRAIEKVTREHQANLEAGAFGVPSFLLGDRVGFVRLMQHPADGEAAREEIERVLELLEWTNLDEFKRPPTKRRRYKGEVNPGK